MKVLLTYFKKNGTYYSSGEYMTDEDDMNDIYYEVGRKLKNGKLPNLTLGSNNFIVLISVPSHINNVLKLIGLEQSDGGINVGGNMSNSHIISGNNNNIGIK